MKLKITLAVAGIAALAISSGAAIAGSPTDRATGGGQVLFSSDGGAGNTIAFTAQDRGSNLGQVQYVDRAAGTGQAQEKYHGTVLCLDVDGNVAKIGGEWRDGGDFNIYVEDNGEGALADNDVVFIDEMTTDARCDIDDPGDDPEFELARGNVQVYDAD